MDNNYKMYECLNQHFFLFSGKGCRPGKNVNLAETEVRALCLKAREIFLSQPMLLELEAPLKICGTCSKVWMEYRKQVFKVMWKI